MKLYYFPLSTYSQKVLIAMHEKGFEYEPELVHLMDEAARNEYRKVYPMGKIPMLMTDEDHMIPESSIIIEYLDSLGGDRLIPEDPERARKTRFKDRMYDNYLNDSIVTLFFQSRKPEADQDPERIQAAKYRAEVMYGFMESEFGNQDYANGDTFSMSDCAAAAGLCYAPYLMPFDDRPNISAYWKRLMERESLQKVHAELAPHLEAMNSGNA